MCSKHGYASENAARKKLRQLRRKRVRRQHQGKIEQRFYRCDFCGQWHLTSRPMDY